MTFVLELSFMTAFCPGEVDSIRTEARSLPPCTFLLLAGDGCPRCPVIVNSLALSLRSPGEAPRVLPRERDDERQKKVSTPCDSHVLLPPIKSRIVKLSVHIYEVTLNRRNAPLVSGGPRGKGERTPAFANYSFWSNKSRIRRVPRPEDDYL